MSSAPPELLPILVAHLADDESRDLVESIALVGGVVHLVLEAAPMDRSLHALEVCTPTREPLVVHALPLGPPTESGYPLQLGLADAPPPQPRQRADSASDLVPRRRTAHTLTEEHTRDLIEDRASVRATSQRERLAGRALAGGKLIIEGTVGRGGAGAVYRARHRDLQIPVAVKVMHQSFERDVEYCRKFHAEALAASRLDQANLTRVLDYGQEPDGLLYLAMEFLDGRSLRDVLHDAKRLEPTRAARLMVQVCTGLTHAHARDVLHRDIKPENLMLVRGLDDDGRETEIVKVCDFGIAHVASSDELASLAGTPEYMAPEQFKKGDELDARVDVYACGVVLYELLTGEVPITGRGVQEIFARVFTVTPEPPSRRVPGLDPRLDAILARALAKDKAARYPSARDMRADLRAYLHALTPNAPFVDPEPSSPSLQAPRVAALPEWLERGTARYQVATELPPQSTDVGRAVAPLLKQLADTTDPAQFGALVPSVENKLRAAMETGYAEAAWRIRSTLDAIASEPRTAAGAGRGPWAEQLLRVMSDPKVLGPSADRALAEPTTSDAARIVVAGGAGGAYALYSSRLKNTDPKARERFVSLLREIGPAATPMLRAGLERLEGKLAMPGAIAIVEDLLRALPRAPDDASGELAARFARVADPGVAAGATATLAHLWGQRARPLLVALLAYPHEAVIVAALDGLKELAAIDEDVLRKLAPVIAGRVTPSVAARVAALDALAHPTLEAADAAREFLATGIRKAPPGQVEDAILLALVRSYLALQGSPSVVAELWNRTHGQLRAQVEALLRAAAPRS